MNYTVLRKGATADHHVALRTEHLDEALRTLRGTLLLGGEAEVAVSLEGLDLKALAHLPQREADAAVLQWVEQQCGHPRCIGGGGAKVKGGSPPSDQPARLTLKDMLRALAARGVDARESYVRQALRAGDIPMPERDSFGRLIWTTELMDRLEAVLRRPRPQRGGSHAIRICNDQ